MTFCNPLLMGFLKQIFIVFCWDKPISILSHRNSIISWFDSAWYSSGIFQRVKEPSSDVVRAKSMTETPWPVGWVDCPGSLLIKRPNWSITSSRTGAFCLLLQLRFHIGLWELMSPAIKTLPRIISSLFTSSKALQMRRIPPSQVHPLPTC